MTASRVERKAVARAQRRNAARLGSVFIAIFVLALAGYWIVHVRAGSAERSDRTLLGQTGSGLETGTKSSTGVTESDTTDVASGESAGEDYLTYAPIPASTDATLVEVPNVIGRAVSDARALLSAAGLTASSLSVTDATAARVLTQRPAAGSIAVAGSQVVLGFSSGSQQAKGAMLASRVVVLDPGHQAHSDTAGEPIGPGSTTLKPRITGGATGVGTRVPEYEVALEVAMNVRARLMKAGVKVVMTRTTNDVNISNAERARKANAAGAALFVRIHADGSTDNRVCGVHTLYPAVTQWTRSTSVPSERAASLIQTAVITSTLAKSDGLTARSDQAGFNWCTRPSVLIECGFLSNSIEDRLLTSPGYQDRLAAGIAAGILDYLGG